MRSSLRRDTTHSWPRVARKRSIWSAITRSISRSWTCICPGLSGLETIAIVRQIKGVIPAILITADQDDNLMRRALSEHAFCVLAKPVSKHVVIYVVHKALEKYYN